jgi:hypothetical protein
MTPPQQRLALEQFRMRLYQAMVNPDKVPTEDVALAWKAWEATVQHDETDCQQNIQRYLEHHHTERLTYETNYTNYKQDLSQAYQAFESSTLATHAKTRRAYVNKLLKPAVLLQPPSSIYSFATPR